MFAPAAAVSVLLLVVTLVVPRLVAQEGTRDLGAQGEGDIVTLDVTAVDAEGHSVMGLHAEDFEIKEDGKRVGVTTFSEITPNDSEIARSLVILMDDVAVPVTGNDTMKTIARALIEGLRRRDDVSVVRLSRTGDEAFGDRPEAAYRIENYRAGIVPFTGWDTAQAALKRVAEISRQLAVTDGRRKIIACIGAPVVCNVPSPQTARAQDLDPAWREAIGAASLANVAVYAISPGRTRVRGGGLVESTGGEIFVSTYDVGPAIDRVLQDANHYYLLGYWPSSGARPLHDIDVKSTRKGVKVKARKLRAQ